MNAPQTTSADRSRIISFGHLTNPEATRAKDDGALLILPVGAVEQHGDGLPLNTDNLRADYVADAVAERLTGRAFVLPPVPYGVSPHHSSFAGTVSLPPRLFIEVVTTIVHQLAAAGWTRLLVVTGHGGNVASLGVIQQDLLGSHPGFHFAFSPVSALAKNTHKSMERSAVTGHSGESETAQVLAIDADAVDTPHLNPGALTLDDLGPRARLSRSKPPAIAVRFEEYAPNGVLGDPRTATIDQGKQILAEIVDTLVDYSESLLSL